MADAQAPAEEELVVVEVGEDGKPLPAEGEAPAAKEPAPAPAPAAAGEDDDDGEEGDSRLATSEDETDEEISRSKKQRQQRRERRKRAEQMSKAELEQLRQITAQQAQRLAALEGHAVVQNSQSLQARYAQKAQEVEAAERIMARATEAGNGDDVVAAMRIRDAARDEANAIAYQARQLQESQQRQQQAPQPQQPQVDPAVVTYAREWTQANPWYDPAGKDENSALTLEIDRELIAEGFKPETRGYWTELTKRVAAEIGSDDGGAAPRARRTGPPVGSSREHAPTTTRSEIRVTPERKAAMIEAGVWDDPSKRQRYLKAYRDFDNQQSAR